MRQRILIAEKSDAIRGVAETVLRQNGYEVISVSSAEKALEVLKFSRPDLMIVGADLVTRNNRPFYERIGEEPKAASIPLLLFADPGDESLPHPGDMRIPRPFDTKDFVRKVTNCVRPAEMAKETAAVTHNPLAGSNVGDEMIDEALGLDHIEVMESEVMDKTATSRKASATEVNRKVNSQVVGLDDSQRGNLHHGDSGPIVESLHISDEDTSKNTPREKPPVADDGLEIVSDHQAYQNPQALVGPESSDHDYEWFINEMKRDATAGANPKTEEAGSAEDISEISPEELVFQNPSTMVDPYTPPPEQKKSQDSNQSGNVEKFIDEFRKEVEKFRDDDLPSTDSVQETGFRGKDDESLGWEETVERLTPKEVAIFTRQVADKIGENVARIIVGRLDPDKLLRLLKQEIVDSARRNAERE